MKGVITLKPQKLQEEEGIWSIGISSIQCHDNPGHVTRNCKMRREFGLLVYPQSGAMTILVMAPEIARGGDGFL